MKNLLLASAAVLALSAFGASAAKAAPEVNAVIDLAGIDQVDTSSLNQMAVSANVGVGAVSNSNLNSSAFNLSEDASQAVDEVIAGTGSLGNGALNLSDIAQKTTAPVTQVALSANGSGGLTGSNDTSLSANLSEDASQTFTVTVKK